MRFSRPVARPVPGFWFSLALACLFALFPLPAHADDASFFLRDGDTVVFYGDSITEQQHYGRDIETYVLTRHPTWHIRFINSGWNSDRVSGGKGGSLQTRIKRDILPYHPTVVTLLLGMNDGQYTRFTQANYDAYAGGMTYLVNKLPQDLPGVRLTLLSPTFYDEKAPGSHHLHGYNAVLLRFRDFVKTLGGKASIPAIDLNAPLAEATRVGRRRDPRFTLVPDGVHPSEAGQALIAAAILKAWGAAPDPIRLTLDPAATAVSLTAPLPWPLPEKAAPAFAVFPLLGALDTFQVSAPGLPAGDYELRVDGKPITTATAQELAAGIDLTRLPLLPQNAQADQVRGWVQYRLDTWRYLWNSGPHAIAHKNDGPLDAETAALAALDHWLDERREQARLAAQPQTHIYALRLTHASPPERKLGP